MDTGTQKVRMTLLGSDGNAFNLLGLFHREAWRQGWSKEDIEAVLAEARAGNYDHLLSTLMAHIEEPPPELNGEA